VIFFFTGQNFVKRFNRRY